MHAKASRRSFSEGGHFKHFELRLASHRFKVLTGAAIALSIVLLARQIVVAERGGSGLVQRRPWVVALIFGLVHGLGLAGSLGEIGLPGSDLPVALLFFNMGVEVGQLAFVGLVVAAWGFSARAGRTVAPRLQRSIADSLGALATVWLCDRLPAVRGPSVRSRPSRSFKNVRRWAFEHLRASVVQPQRPDRRRARASLSRRGWQGPTPCARTRNRSCRPRNRTVHTQFVSSRSGAGRIATPNLPARTITFEWSA